MRLTIEQILMQDYDKLKRDETGTIVYDKRPKQIADNLLNHPSLDSQGCRTYDEYFNVLLNETHQVQSQVYTLPDGCQSEYRYVNDVITREIWSNWLPLNSIFISAGTGRGKNTFIKMELLKHIGSAKVVIFENRESLMQQQIVDIVSEIDPEALKYQDISEESMVIFGSDKNIMLISYQTAAIKCALGDQRFLGFCQGARYLIFDEAHYILDDANFNKGINSFVNGFLPRNAFPNATKIFMSGSMEEFYTFLQTVQPFTKEPSDIYKEKELLDSRRNDPTFPLTKELFFASISEHILSMPTDYSYIKPYKYKELKDICSQITQTAIDEKWVIFVKSIEEGVRLQSALQSICGDSVRFLDATNKNSDENEEIYNQLVHKSRFDCRVLIATTVIYNGINIKDSAVKHIVVPFTTVSVIKQLIGRKRVNEGETVNIYFPTVTYKALKKRYQNCIEDYMELIGLRYELPVRSLIQLNNLSHARPSKYYYLEPVTVSDTNGNSLKMLSPILNQPSIHKLYYDTCFYIYALHRMNSELGDGANDFVSILLAHLGITDNCAEVIDITSQTQGEKTNSTRQDLAAYLEGLIGTPIISPDDNDSYDTFLELKRIINEAYKTLHEGKNLDTQWSNKDRFFSAEKVKAFLLELSLPYDIHSEAKNKHRTTTVTKQEQ